MLGLRYLYAANYKSQLLHGCLRRAHSVRRQNQGTRRRATHTPWTRIQLASGPRHGGNSRAHAASESCALSRQAARVLGDSGLSRPASLGGRERGPLPLSPESRRPARGPAARPRRLRLSRSRPADRRRPKAGACHIVVSLEVASPLQLQRLDPSESAVRLIHPDDSPKLIDRLARGS